MNKTQLSAIAYALDYLCDEGPKDIYAHNGSIQWDESIIKWEQPFYVEHKAHVSILQSLLEQNHV